MDSDTYICPLTHVVLDQPVYQTNCSFTAEGRPVTHWDTYKLPKSQRRKSTISTRASKPAASLRRPKPCTPDIAERIVYRCFTAGQTMAELRKNKRTRSATSNAKRIRPTSFSLCAHLVRQNAVFAQPPSNALARVLGTSISTFLARHGKAKLGSTEIAIATMLTLMSTGLVINGINVVEKVCTLQSRIPLPTEMSSIKKINCRGISMGIRNFKDYVLSQTGTPVYNKCFRLTDHERQSIFRATFNVMQ